MKKRAVVVGINDYTSIDLLGRSNLNSCVSDARSIAGLLPDAFGFEASDISVLTD